MDKFPDFSSKMIPHKIVSQEELDEWQRAFDVHAEGRGPHPGPHPALLVPAKYGEVKDSFVRAVDGGPGANDAEISQEDVMKQSRQVVKDQISRLTLPGYVKLHCTDPVGEMSYQLEFDLTEVECFWKGGKYVFQINFTVLYPQAIPSVKCLTPIFHPFIDQYGNVFLCVLGLFNTNDKEI